jgi:hypothetical protein
MLLPGVPHVMGLVDDAGEEFLVEDCTGEGTLCRRYVPRPSWGVLLLPLRFCMRIVHISEDGLLTSWSVWQLSYAREMTYGVTGHDNPVVRLMVGDVERTIRAPELGSVGLAVVDKNVDAFWEKKHPEFGDPLGYERPGANNEVRQRWNFVVFSEVTSLRWRKKRR